MTDARKLKKQPPETVQWLDREGKPVACLEKNRVLNENLSEIRTICGDALDDAILMGCAPERFRDVLHAMIDHLETTLDPDDHR